MSRLITLLMLSSESEFLRGTNLNQFSDLSWVDLEEWAGSKIVSRGRDYQRRGTVADLAVTPDDGLVAWIRGTERYAVKVSFGLDGKLNSICTCPYGFACKHAVAVVLEYLKRIEQDRSIILADADDEQLRMLEIEVGDDDLDLKLDPLAADPDKAITTILKDKTKSQLISLITELAHERPDISKEIMERQRLQAGDSKSVITRLRREIRDIGDEPGWQNYWRNEGFTPDFSKIRSKLQSLLKAGYADEVLELGRELIETGNRLVESSDDEGETGMEVAKCMPIVVEALDRSSLEPVDKLKWALDALFKDQFEICEAFAQYLHRSHPTETWRAFADNLLARLKGMKRAPSSRDFSRNFDRDRLSNWIIHALEQSGRKEEIIPLCEAEAKVTMSYDRLVARLIKARKLTEAEQWIREGIRTLGNDQPGIVNSLRKKYQEIRVIEGNWPVVAAIDVEEFVRSPSMVGYLDCRKVCDRVGIWKDVRKLLLTFLEKGNFPWISDGWPLTETGLERLKIGQKSRSPRLDLLMAIAIEEQEPDQVLYWFDQIPKSGIGWREVTDDDVAEAVKSYAPDRAVDIWKKGAEELIAEVKPRAYGEAAMLLRKARSIESLQGKQAQWDQYISELRIKHRPKRKLMEILDGLEDKPIMKKRR